MMLCSNDVIVAGGDEVQEAVRGHAHREEQVQAAMYSGNNLLQFCCESWILWGNFFRNPSDSFPETK